MSLFKRKTERGQAILEYMWDRHVDSGYYSVCGNICFGGCYNTCINTCLSSCETTCSGSLSNKNEGEKE